MPLVLPHSYNTGRVIRTPAELNTVGDHIRKRRLDLKMLQREIAEQIGVDTTSVFKWEANTVSPDIRCMPAIIQFLGYNPLSEATGWGARLVRHRTSLGMTQGEAAKRLGVDPGTLAKWEQGNREPTGALLGARSGSSMKRRRGCRRGGSGKRTRERCSIPRVCGLHHCYRRRAA